MTTLQNSKSVSLLNLILPKESVVKVSSAVEKAGAKGVFQISARGSVLNEGGFLQKCFLLLHQNKSFFKHLFPIT